ncbi:unnamed protein product [Musa hybrid cultivar]
MKLSTRRSQAPIKAREMARRSMHFAATLVFLGLSLLGSVRSDFESDRAECAGQLIGLATCLTYIEGSAKAPTVDCCSGFKQVVTKSLKCLCVLIRNRDNPNLGFKINVTRALLLPSKCDTPAQVTECPRLLNLPQNSAEAKVFEEFGEELKANAASSYGNSTGSMATGGKTSDQRGNSSLSKSGEANKRRLGMSMDGGFWTFSLVLLVLLFN